MHSSQRLILSFVALIACSVCHAQEPPSLPSHCKQGEVVYLNAHMPELRYPRYKTEEKRRTKPGWVLHDTGKTLSICADHPVEPLSSVAYRFGAVGKVEFERVATKSSPFYVFERSTSPHTGEAVLFFSVGPYTYCVSEATAQGSGIGLTVLKDGREVASYFSGNGRGTDYESGLLEVLLSETKSPALKVFPLKNEFQTPCDGKRLMRP